MALNAILQAAPYVLQGISMLGGIFGRNKKKYLDEETMRRLYGPHAVARDATELSRYIINSPYGQQLLASAAEQGQTFQNEMASRAAAAGLDPSSGGQSGAGDFSVGAAAGAQSGFERAVRSDVTQAAMPLASQMVAGRMQAALGQQEQQNADTVNTLGRIGSIAGQVAATLPTKAPAVPAATNRGLPAQSLVGAATAPYEMPQRRLPGQPVMQQALATNVVSGRKKRRWG